MDPSLLLYSAIIVFSLMITGLVLTVWEFSRGAPKEQARARQERPRRIRSVQFAERS